MPTRYILTLATTRAMPAEEWAAYKREMTMRAAQDNVVIDWERLERDGEWLLVSAGVTTLHRLRIEETP